MQRSTNSTTTGLGSSNLDQAVKEIDDACETTGGAHDRPVAAFGYPTVLDTSSVRFETSLSDRHVTKNSELNIAACHSHFETACARALDKHPDVTSWARNFRLGWSVPYLWEGTWHRYEPDFVARLFAGHEDDDAVHLIIECKGVPDDQSERKKQSITRRWIPAVQASGNLSQWLRRWSFVELDEPEGLSADLSAAIKAARAEHPKPDQQGGSVMAKRASTKTTDQYTHPSAKRVNLPTEQTGKTMSDAARRPILHQPQSREIDDEPILAWNRQPANQDGHAAHPLYVREKVHPAAFVKLLQGSGDQPQLFSDFNGLPSPDAAYEWYQHAANWSNRLIHGESTRVMASLLARENMTGKVQMVYFDPPYGMGYKSNFQVSVNSRETPEKAEGRPLDTRTIRAFRDTYERNIHSYLDLTREKLVLMRELLADTGSLFMQIGDENVLRAGLLLDEIFGPENRVVVIPFVTTGSSSSNTLPSVADFLLWYAKDAQKVKYRQLYERLTRAEKIAHMSSYAAVQLPDGTTRTLTAQEKHEPDVYLPDGSRLYGRMPLVSRGTSTTGRSGPYYWNGKHWPCPSGQQWRVSMDGMDHLAEMGRLDAASPDSALRWKRYEDEVPGRQLNNIWHQQMSASDKRYVVQTADSVIERCVLMATDPGDLVFDPTCGGATTAIAAEKWGRRWITCDTSPVRRVNRTPTARHRDVPILDTGRLCRRRTHGSSTLRQSRSSVPRRWMGQRPRPRTRIRAGPGCFCKDTCLRPQARPHHVGRPAP